MGQEPHLSPPSISFLAQHAHLSSISLNFPELGEWDLLSLSLFLCLLTGSQIRYQSFGFLQDFTLGPHSVLPSPSPTFLPWVWSLAFALSCEAPAGNKTQKV